jgi:hypothetical protein
MLKAYYQAGAEIDWDITYKAELIYIQKQQEELITEEAVRR